MTQIDRINGLIGSIAVKAPCRAATTASITLSGEQTIDGIAVIAEDRVLVKNQTITSENGIYDVSATTWTRSTDFNGKRDFTKGTLVRAIEGTSNANINFEVTSSGTTVGVSSITFNGEIITSDVTYYANIAALRAITIVPTITNATIRGYYADGDGGGGDFYWGPTSTDTEVSGMIVKATAITAGRWIRLYSGAINPEWFGAKGDGTLTTTEQQEAINYCATNSINLEYPVGYFKATALYGKYDASLNPGFPTNGGRFQIYGAGRLDYARAISGNNGRTTIELTDSTGDVFDCGHPVSPYRLKQFEISHLTIIGDTTGYVLNTEGSFKCVYEHLVIYNKNAAGGGWNNGIFDACKIDNILIIGDVDTFSTGTGMILSNTDATVDGSLSNISRILVRGFALGYRFGYERSLGTDGNYQQYNHVSNCASNDCTEGAYFGDRWQNNTFTSCQFRGTDTGGKIGSRFNNNKFETTLFEGYSGTTTVQGLLLGDGDTAANRQADNNEFDRCILKSSVAGSPALMWAGAVGANLVLNNTFKECSFDGAGVTLTNAIEFTGLPTDTTGAVINCKFTSYTNEFSAIPRRIDYIPIEKVRGLTYEAQTADATVTTLIEFPVRTGEVLTVKATVVARGTATADHAGYVKQLTVYDNSGTATIIGAETNIATHELTGGMNAVLSVSTDRVRVRITGVAATTIDWIGRLEIVTLT